MSKILGASLLGAISILLLAGLGVVETPPNRTAQALPQISADAPRADTPRECSVAVTTACTYQ